MAQWLRAPTALPEGPEFNSQHPHGSLQLSVIPVPGDPTSHTDTHADKNTNVHKIQINKFKKKEEEVYLAHSVWRLLVRVPQLHHTLAI